MSKSRKRTSPGRARKETNAANAKVERLAPAMADAADQVLTTNQGLPVNDDQNSLKAGERGGTLLEDFKAHADALHFVDEAYRHCKAIAATGEGIEVLAASYLGATGAVDTDGDGGQVASKQGVVTGGNRQAAKVASAFVDAIAQHRFWARETEDRVPA